MPIITKIVKFILTWLLKDILKSILTAEIKEYWKKNKKQLIMKYGMPHLPKLLKARAALQRTRAWIDAKRERMRNIGRRGKARPADGQDAKPPRQKTTIPPTGRPPPAKDPETPPSGRTAASMFGTVRDRAADLVKRGRELVSGTAPETGRAPEPKAPQPPAQDPPAAVPPPDPPPERPPQPPEQEETNAEFTKRLEEMVRRQREERAGQDKK